MGLEEAIREKLVFMVFTQKEFKSKEEVISFLAKQLLKRGYVKESFLPAVMEREEKFPTGLPTEIPVAIPHADAKYCNHSVFAVATLKNPISFKEMGDPNHSIPVEIVFLLALKNPKDQVKIIQQLILKLHDTRILKNIKNSRSPQELQEYLLGILNTKGGTNE